MYVKHWNCNDKLPCSLRELELMEKIEENKMPSMVAGPAAQLVEYLPSMHHLCQALGLILSIAYTGYNVTCS